MTYREYVEKNYPEKVNELYCGGVYSCPGSYIKGTPVAKEYGCSYECISCFNSEIPHDAVDANTGKRVYPYKVKIKRKVKSK